MRSFDWYKKDRVWLQGIYKINVINVIRRTNNNLNAIWSFLLDQKISASRIGVLEVKKLVEKNSESTITLKVAKNLCFRYCWSILFCSSDEPTESNV